jgi:hypothetical protein
VIIQVENITEYLLVMVVLDSLSGQSDEVVTILASPEMEANAWWTRLIGTSVEDVVSTDALMLV